MLATCLCELWARREALISHNQEGFAATVLEECLMLSGVPRLASETDTDKDKNLTKAGGVTNRIHFQDSATHSQYHAGTGLTNLESVPRWHCWQGVVSPFVCGTSF